MAVLYEIYVDGAEASAGFQLGGDSGGVTLSGGGLSSSVFYATLKNPNAIPTVQDPSQWGGPNAKPWLYTPDRDLVSVTAIRYFLRAVRLKVQWDDLTHAPVPITGRWVGGGQRAWIGDPTILFQNPFGSDVALAQLVLGFQRWSHGTTEDHYTLTDGSGIATYYMAAGIGVNYGGSWRLHSPASVPFVGSASPSGYGTQSVLLATRAFQVSPERADFHPIRIIGQQGGTPDDLPYDIDEGHYYRQLSYPSPFGDGGRGIGFDYASSWNVSTGVLSPPALGLLTHSYTQYLSLYLSDSGAPVDGATVAFGGGLYTGVTGAGTDPDGNPAPSGKCWIPANPKGSWLAPVFPRSSDPLTQIDLDDASAYAAAVLPGAAPPAYPVLVPPFRPHPESNKYRQSYTSKSGDSLLGVATVNDLGVPLRIGDFAGGEIATLPYGDVHVQKGATVYVDMSGEPERGLAYVYEEEGVDLVFGLVGGVDSSVDADGLDYCQDAFGEPFLTESREPDVVEWFGVEMERDFNQFRALREKVKSPSQAVLADHCRLLLGVVDGAARVWETRDLWETDKTGTSVLLDDSRTWQEAILREHPSHRLHAFLTTDAGAVYVVTSQDGGATWDAPVATGLSSCRGERGDVRYVVERWFRAHPEGPTEGILLYQSYDGETWELVGGISGAGNFPWLLRLPDGRLGVLYHSAGEVKFRSGDDASGSWVWTSAATVATADPTGPVGVANGQKILCAYRKSKTDLGFAVSFDAGETWADGSEG